MRRPWCVVAAAVLLAGCAVGPDYKRPDVKMPAEFRGPAEVDEAASLADLPWWDVFRDDTLRHLIQEALDNNYDLLTAAARVEQARAQVGVARSEIYPQLNYQGEAARGKFFNPASSSNVTANSFLGVFNLAWEIDVWGRIRRSSEAALGDLMATEEFRRGVVLGLVSAVSQAYFELLELDLELEIARRTTESFQETLQLFERQYRGGVGNKLATSRAAAALAQTAAQIPFLENQIVAKENQINILLGRSPTAISRGAPLVVQTLPLAPPGLPSSLLERRPDILQAEESMVAANALVGVATANFFPRIGLTSLYGGQSTDLDNIVKGPGNIWLIAGQLAGPLFRGGALIESYRGQVAVWEQARWQYAQAIVTALGEVSNSLTAQTKLEEVEAQQQLAVVALREAVRLATLRYEGGLASYYEVLEAQQQLFPAENALAQTQRDQLLAVVQLYRALGGGWGPGDFTEPGWLDFACRESPEYTPASLDFE